MTEGLRDAHPACQNAPQPPHLVARNPLALCCISHISGGEHLCGSCRRRHGRDAMGEAAGVNRGTTVQLSATTPPPPCRTIACARQYLRTPEGTYPKRQIPRPPNYYAKDPRHETRHADTRAYEPQNEPETACWDTYSALLKDRLCVPVFLAGVFDSEGLHTPNRGHRNGLSSCRLGCTLG